MRLWKIQYEIIIRDFLSFDDDTCTTATADATYDHTSGYKNDVCTAVPLVSYYTKATCTDDNDIMIYSHCDSKFKPQIIMLFFRIN